MTGWLTFALAVVIVVTVALTRARFYPYGRCWACRGRKSGPGSTARAFSKCWQCGGSGVRVRTASRIFPRWREEVRRRK